MAAPAEQAGASWARFLALVLLCLAVLTPGLAALPPTDRDESRFAQASRQMAETGNHVDIRFQDVPRYKKPIGIYWLQSAAVALVGEGAASPIWVYRLPSLLGAMMGVLLLYGFGRRFAGENVAFAAAALLAAALTMNIEARLAKTDAMLLGSTVGALAAFGLVYVRRAAGQAVSIAAPLAGWAFMGIGILIKGPITPLIAALAVASLAIADRGKGRTLDYLKALRPLAGLIIVAAIAVPWIVAITLLTKGAFLANSVGGDLVPKLLGGEESHGAPPGYYFVTLSAMLWPGAVLVGLGIPWAFAQRREPWVRFCLAWAVPGFLLFELVPTKLPHYTLPYFPALLLLGTAAALDGFRPETGLGKAWRFLVLAVFGAVGLALGCGLAGLEWHFAGGPGLAGIAAAAVGAMATVAALVLLARGAAGRAIPIMVVGAAFLYGAAFSAILPGIDALWPARGVRAELDRLGLENAPALVATGYGEPSLVFETRTDLKITGAEDAGRIFAATPGAVALVEAGSMDAFKAAIGSTGFQDLAHVKGINVSRGKPVDIAILQRTP
ncbi:ArnT family glycosyltransferase [Zavarzinia sp.]|uniref:ArnT family glycosyltransferase n=1 Tax=Zavarzinia sp. TaxID=2027920 RepID=UPI003561463A